MRLQVWLLIAHFITLIFSSSLWAAVQFPSRGQCRKAFLEPNDKRGERLVLARPDYGSRQHIVRLIDKIFAQSSPAERERVKKRFFEILGKQVAVSKKNHFFEHPDRNKLWELESFEVVAYPDQISVEGRKGDLRSLKEALAYLGQKLESLGVPMKLATHILPPFESPMVDNGYDVSHLTQVRQSLGGISAMKSLLDLKKQNLKNVDYRFTLDLIANHISDQSELFQRAIHGDQKALDMFIYATEKPEQETILIEGAKWVSYKIRNSDGSYKKQVNRLIFPDFANSHYREVTLSDGRKVWVFHYFYPEQIDLNWKNPEVLFEYLNTLNFWLNAGVDIFRLDAIPFLEKSQESHPSTLNIVELLKIYTDAVAPQVRFRSESNQPLEVLSEFIGKEVEVAHGVTKELRKTSERATGAYHFPLLPKFWASSLSGEKVYFEEAVKAAAGFTNTGVLTLMARTHDELTLEIATPQERDIIRKELLIDHQRGERFRGETDEEALGVSGRIAEFLGFDPSRIRLANAVLFSLKGMPSVQLGDIIGLGNDHQHAKAVSQKTGNVDTREINRGPIALEDIKEGGGSAYQKQVFQDFLSMVKARFNSQALLYGNQRVLENNSSHVSSFIREFQGEKVLVLHNFSEQAQTLKISGKELGLWSASRVHDLISGKSVGVSTSELEISIGIGPYGSYFLKLE